MTKQITNTCKAASFSLWRLGKIRHLLNRKLTEKLVHAFITSHLDYCNSLYIGIPDFELDKFQTIQNSAARLITRTKKYDHITPIRYELHWLPIEYRIKYKIICLTFKVLKKDTPCYLRDLLFVRDVGRPLRNENCFNLYQPIPKTKYYGERAFSICSPKLWNGLPTDLRSLDSFHRFKSQLKTYLFKIAYSIS